ncbi:predicted protein [Naegleria gruberi]|uniref:DNA-directed RNA polymerase subunit n=1 Tax=Naegleria gruberi TaxID=5762 RepID=D2V0G9_NAEGR|nr:uncharacterized protein NAEGRDRAFT_35014 [Naegleria gruberi]EFC49521.1 predicted protein [Naegleria gruberi]|eukprot:XP_002682265.1 predicted protein [Naegleria gruberi strain NEG-M]
MSIQPSQNVTLEEKVHERVVQHVHLPKRISQIKFSVFTPEDIRRMSTVQIYNQHYYTPDKRGFPHGPLDPRLGTGTKKDICETCGLGVADCIGHYGYVKLELPVFHIGFISNVVEVLQRICKDCSRVLLSDSEIQSFRNKFKRPMDNQQKKALYKKVGELCKKCSQCPHCGSLNGKVTKLNAIKIVHEKYKVASTRKGKDDIDQQSREFQSEFGLAVQLNPEIEPFLGEAQDDINPIRCLRLFKNISDTDVEVLNMNPKVVRPENFILTHILVPPLVIRPTVNTDGGTNEDDLTAQMKKIIETNIILRESVEQGAIVQNFMEKWDTLQLETALYINSDTRNIPSFVTKKKVSKTLCQRLKGKHGRFRGNLSGKRANFTGRTVISPDPNLEINQVAIPELVAKVLTYPEVVNRTNKKLLQSLILNGPEVHPGANFVIKSDGIRKNLAFAKDKMEVAKNLKFGDIVERHVMNGDYALFNRQPSLHRLSIMCHRVKVLPYRTFRFNVCDCAPYNADFDGDEMNVHIPQTEEAKAEAGMLMDILKNLITPKNGDPVISCNQDFLTAAWKMTRKNTFFDRAEFCMLCSYMGIEDKKIDLPPPTILKPIELWTGKQLFSLLVKPNNNTNVFVNFETKAKNYLKDETMCPNDGYVCFRNSYLICGNLDKKILGDGSKSSLFYVLIRTVGPAYAAACMARVARVASRWLMNYGFSIGIDDVMPSAQLTEKKKMILSEGYAVCDEYIKLYKDGKLEPQPGCNMEQTLEAKLNRELSEIRGRAGSMCLDELHWLNAPLTMSVCGSKGSVINISQMIACVGQQTVGGTRIANGFMNRTLPHFPMFARDPAAKGFVSNSFFTGLTPTEFFFHTMGGREGIVDTAVKTAETGYMQRRLMKALEDLFVAYDGSVRSADNTVIQFKYGDDGMDPHRMESEESGRPLNFTFVMMHEKNINLPTKDEKALTPDEIRQKLDSFLKEKESNIFSDKFIDELSTFTNNYIFKLENLLKGVAAANSIRDENENNAWEKVVHYIEKITDRQLTSFFRACRSKYFRALAEPGEPVGGIAGQSIGEPTTQMTLKTFHFAGVASMNVTLGVPRIKEIIDATKNISTPIITAYLDTPLTATKKQKEMAARVVKGRIEKTTLGQVVNYIREVYNLGICYIEIDLDVKQISALQLDITPETVKNSILYSPLMKFEKGKEKSKDKTKLSDEPNLVQIQKGKVRVYPPSVDRDRMYFNIQKLKRYLPEVIVAGIPTTNRAVINEEKGNVYLLVEGTDLLAVMGTPGVLAKTTKTNNIIEISQTLGIESARQLIMDEIKYTTGSYGMNIDTRHIKLLADIMTFKGDIFGIQRHGIIKIRDSVLKMASFEQTTDHLFEAASHTRVDDVNGVSECIIMGVPIPIGTGLFRLLQDAHVDKKRSLPINRKKPIFSTKSLLS